MINIRTYKNESSRVSVMILHYIFSKADDAVRFANYALFSTFLVWYAPVASAASIGLSPAEIVVESGVRQVTARVFNKGDSAVNLRLSLIDLKMTVSGGLRPLNIAATDDTANHYAANKLRVIPRIIEIPPNASQVIKILVRPDAYDHKGIFHTHLNIKVLPSLDEFIDRQSAVSVSSASNGAKKLAMNVMPIINFAYPVWLETVPSPGVTATIDDLQMIKLPDGRHAVSVTLRRAGRSRLKGDLTVDFQPADDRPPILLGTRKKVAVYPETPKIKVSVPLLDELLAGAGLTASQLLSTGDRLRIVYQITVPVGVTDHPVADM